MQPFLFKMLLEGQIWQKSLLNVKTSGRFFQIFVVSSENLNFDQQSFFYHPNIFFFLFSCDQVVKKGMIFNINIGFTGLVNKDASNSKGKDVALFVGDTVIVTDSSSPATMLTPSKKKIKNIAIFLKDEESEEEEDEKVLILTFPAKNSIPKICEIDRS